MRFFRGWQFRRGCRKPCRRTNWQRPPGTLALRLISVLAPLLVTAAASPASAHAGAMGPGALLTVHGGWAVYVCVWGVGEGSVTIGIGASLVHMDSSSGLREGDELQWYEVLDEKHEFHACMTASPRYEGGGSQRRDHVDGVCGHSPLQLWLLAQRFRRCWQGVHAPPVCGACLIRFAFPRC